MKDIKVIPENERQNRFILFYTLKWLWRKNNHPVDELHRIVGNRTLYDSIMAMKSVDLDDRLQSLSDKIGLPKEYFDGNKKLEFIGITERQWGDYIRLRAKRSEERDNGGGKSSELIRIEGEINSALKDIYENRSAIQSTVFRKLMYFAKYMRKDENTIESHLLEIEQKIEGLERRELNRAKKDALQKHYEVIKKHLDRLSAIMILSEWDQEKKR
ncbi:hypothetical protein [Anaerotignum sp.]